MLILKTFDEDGLYNNLDQLKKATERFGAEEVTFVGARIDNWMIKNKQIEDLQTAGFHYITAIMKLQIERLINNGIIQIRSWVSRAKG
ncbi:hypothetical protein [Candidatus Magnetominusculus xianensis]|uniref:Uncharacterized protein n=1 Tax=Candidatus Magnetominusculus xianensis TaxID=1748249 RepID=A0ABR5SBK0_9BACT|nr:hypothetical protein [Candidatus Magnetominusculus xianensis]KWT78148.1 hypothetical protein ASN18_3017 [Candidatus Magnetominusculus xianensis]MBF0403958.1 hypothetical protein [Nitrospirota bacterium]